MIRFLRHSSRTLTKQSLNVYLFCQRMLLFLIIALLLQYACSMSITLEKTLKPAKTSLSFAYNIINEQWLENDMFIYKNAQWIIFLITNFTFRKLHKVLNYDRFYNICIFSHYYGSNTARLITWFKLQNIEIDAIHLTYLMCLTILPWNRWLLVTAHVLVLITKVDTFK